MKMVAQSTDLKKIGVTVRNTRQTRKVGILLEIGSAQGVASRHRQDQDDPSQLADPCLASRHTQVGRRSSHEGWVFWDFGVTPEDLTKMSLKESR